MIRLPKLRKPTSGMFFSRGSWSCGYTVGDAKRAKRLGTADLATAQARRDAFYATLRAQGAVTAPNRVTVKPNSYIIVNKKPYKVVIRKHHVGSFATLDEARAARDLVLNPNPLPK